MLQIPNSFTPQSFSKDPFIQNSLSHNSLLHQPFQYGSILQQPFQHGSILQQSFQQNSHLKGPFQHNSSTQSWSPENTFTSYDALYPHTQVSNKLSDINLNIIMTDEERKEALEKLISMGFDHSKAQAALEKCFYNVSFAVEILTVILRKGNVCFF